MQRPATQCRLPLGRVAATRDPHSSEIYAGLRKRGQSHGCALRGIADRLLRVLIAMLKNRTLYDPSRWATSTPTAPAPAPESAPGPAQEPA